jgi:hypothetical protein
VWCFLCVLSYSETMPLHHLSTFVHHTAYNGKYGQSQTPEEAAGSNGIAHNTAADITFCQEQLLLALLCCADVFWRCVAFEREHHAHRFGVREQRIEEHDRFAGAYQNKESCHSTRA